MEIVEVSPGMLAFVRPDEGANAGLICTANGVVVVDTTSSPPDMQELLDAAGVSASEARLVINTHSHGDHTWGNQLFDCPILAHRLCREKMVANLGGPWSAEAIKASIAEREKTDPDSVREARDKLADLRITLPTEVFEDCRELEIGSVRLQVIHFGAHTPDSTVVWLPEAKVLFAGDLIFEGRYPYLGEADVLALIAALKWLPEFGAQTIVPGHGVLCGEAEIAALVDYLETAWALTADHLAQSHSEDEAAADPNYPRYAEGDTQRLHENIRVMYAQLRKGVR
ncbi:MAG: MBL fold metallo-hydrolase [Anaerolineae bacterium]